MCKYLTLQLQQLRVLQHQMKHRHSNDKLSVQMLLNAFLTNATNCTSPLFHSSLLLLSVVEKMHHGIYNECQTGENTKCLKKKYNI